MPGIGRRTVGEEISLSAPPLRTDHKLLRGEAAETAAPVGVRRVKSHNDAAHHGHNANDLTAGFWAPKNPNATPEKEHFQRRGVVILISGNNGPGLRTSKFLR